MHDGIIDMSGVIVPKSDQMNADDLIAGPRTITIREVRVNGGGEQPVSIYFHGDNNKPYKACKSMCRVLVQLWGADAKAYVGRSLTLCRDPSVKWGGLEVGGIRISHMTDIERDVTLVLTASKTSRKPYVVKVLTDINPPTTPTAPAVERPEAEAKLVDSIRSLCSELNATGKDSIKWTKATTNGFIEAMFDTGITLETGNEKQLTTVERDLKERLAELTA